MFMPSIGQWAKLLFSDIRDLYISEYGAPIHGEYDRSHVGRRFLTLFKRGHYWPLL